MGAVRDFESVGSREPVATVSPAEPRTTNVDSLVRTSSNVSRMVLGRVESLAPGGRRGAEKRGVRQDQGRQRRREQQRQHRGSPKDPHRAECTYGPVSAQRHGAPSGARCRRRTDNEAMLQDHLDPDQAYRPGVCNIGPAEVERRRRSAIGATIMTGIVAVLILALGLPSTARLALLPFATATAITWLQVTRQFCVAFGAVGLRNFGALGSETTVSGSGGPDGRSEDDAQDDPRGARLRRARHGRLLDRRGPVAALLGSDRPTPPAAIPRRLRLPCDARAGSDDAPADTCPPPTRCPARIRKSPTLRRTLPLVPPRDASRGGEPLTGCLRLALGDPCLDDQVRDLDVSLHGWGSFRSWLLVDGRMSCVSHSSNPPG